MRDLNKLRGLRDRRRTVNSVLFSRTLALFGDSSSV